MLGLLVLAGGLVVTAVIASAVAVHLDGYGPRPHHDDEFASRRRMLWSARSFCRHFSAGGREVPTKRTSQRR